MQRLRTTTSAAAVALLFLALGATTAWSQQRDVCCPKYDVALESTVQGVIEAVETRYGQAGSAGIHLMVRAGGEVYDVHLGPKRYVKQQGVDLAKDDSITMLVAPVSGAERAAGAPLEVVARQITRGEETLVLRESDGAPRWRRSAT